MKRTPPPIPLAERSTSGFGLLELVLAAAIMIAAVLTGLLALVPLSRQARLRREVGSANVAAQRVLEKIQAAPFNEILTEYPPSYTETISDLGSGSLTVSYADPTADPLLVQVNLTWQNADAGTMQRTFNTIRTE